MKFILSYFLLLLLSTLLVKGKAAIELQLSSSECFPGDLVELHAVSSSPNYHEFTLTVPSHKYLILVARETGPVTLHDGKFSQSHHWTLQAVAPSEISLGQITATFSGTEESIPLAPLSLIIRSHDTLDTDTTPASFPEITDSSENFAIFWSIPLLAIIIIVSFKYRKKAIPNDPPRPTVSLKALQMQLAKGTLPEDLCYALIDQDTLTNSQRENIERALYQPSFTAGDLLKALRKEDLA